MITQEVRGTIEIEEGRADIESLFDVNYIEKGNIDLKNYAPGTYNVRAKVSGRNMYGLSLIEFEVLSLVILRDDKEKLMYGGMTRKEAVDVFTEMAKSFGLNTVEAGCYDIKKLLQGEAASNKEKAISFFRKRMQEIANKNGDLPDIIPYTLYGPLSHVKHFTFTKGQKGFFIAARAHVTMEEIKNYVLSAGGENLVEGIIPSVPEVETQYGHYIDD